MSVSRLVYVHCDGCGDVATPDPDPGETATEQRRDAAAEGWHRTGPGYDICPVCWEAGIRGPKNLG